MARSASLEVKMGEDEEWEADARGAVGPRNEESAEAPKVLFDAIRKCWSPTDARRRQPLTHIALYRITLRPQGTFTSNVDN